MGRFDVSEVPDGAGISVTTLSGIHLGVAADDPDERCARLTTLLAAERLTSTPFPSTTAWGDALRRSWTPSVGRSGGRRCSMPLRPGVYHAFA